MCLFKKKLQYTTTLCKICKIRSRHTVHSFSSSQEWVVNKTSIITNPLYFLYLKTITGQNEALIQCAMSQKAQRTFTEWLFKTAISNQNIAVTSYLESQVWMSVLSRPVPSRPVPSRPVPSIPDICHFFTRAKFLENKIYTKIYTVNCQFTQ